jgi:hypothetical protein
MTNALVTNEVQQITVPANSKKTVEWNVNINDINSDINRNSY